MLFQTKHDSFHVRALLNRTHGRGLHPMFEALESRCLLSAIAEAEPNNSFSSYQPLNNDSTYSVSGGIASLGDVDYFGFYASKGSNVTLNCRASVITGDPHTEFDPTIGLFSPGGTLVSANDDSGTGSIWRQDCRFPSSLRAFGGLRLAIIMISRSMAATSDLAIRMVGPECIRAVIC